jgi:GNAT superfamily N-acetyltransferase
MRLYGIGEIDRVQSLFRLLWSAGENWRQSYVAEHDGQAVGLLQVGSSGIKVSPRLVVSAFRVLGVAGVVRALRAMRLNNRVSPKKDPGWFIISELHVGPAARGQGIGGQLLDFAESLARQGGAGTMALHTLTTNPARRLYERHGFTVASSATDAAFEKLTGCAGNVLMVKPLQAA